MEQQYEAAQELLDLIRKKQELVKRLIQYLEIQADCFQGQTMDEDRFDRMEEMTSDYLGLLDQNNSRLDSVLPKAGPQIEAMIRHKDPMAEKIHQESDELARLSAQMTAVMAKGKAKLQEYLATERDQIKTKRVQQKSAATYYKNMTSPMDATSFFYDKKK